MRKRVFGRRFNRNIKERKALFNSLIEAFIMRGKIKTTEAKAKAVKGDIEKLVTKVKKDGVNTTYYLSSHLKPEVVKVMVNNVAPAFMQKSGGYIRLLKIGKRVKDGASMVAMEWTENVKVQLPELKRKKEAVEKKEIKVKKEKQKEEKK